MNTKNLLQNIVKIGNSKNTKLATELLPHLKHSNGNVRRLTCSALGKLKNPIAETHLIKLLEDEKPQVRQYAIIALGKLGSKQSVNPLKAVAESDGKEYNRRAARTALKEIASRCNIKPPKIPTKHTTKKREQPHHVKKRKDQKIELNREFKKALHFMEETDKHLFITGRAGTGKSTLLEYFRDKTEKNIAVLAPTGVAAVNICGQTIHSFFKFGPDITPSKVRKEYHNRDRDELYKKLDAIIIDEISMVRADLLDCVDQFLRQNAKSKKKPFGGIQMIFIGDLYQLPPVVTGPEKMAFKTLYESPYFFAAHVLQSINLKLIELKKIYRQKDETFIEILNAIRNKTVKERHLDTLNKKINPKFNPRKNEFYIYLTPTNKLADSINNKRLERLPGEVFNAQGTIDGQFKKNALPTKLNLNLKIGAQVMLVNNDRQGRWINGTVGQVIDFEEDTDYKNPIVWVRLENGEEEPVLPHTWEMFEFFVDSKNGKLSSQTTGSFTQYPLRLAWAITIHKSQGKTFEHVILDIGRGAFTHGQTYVALSRCTSLEGLVLKKPLQKKHIWMDWRVVNFLTDHKYEEAENKLPAAKKAKIIQKAIDENRDLEITYLKTDDNQTRRTIEPFAVGNFRYKDKDFMGVKGFCHLRRAERIFRIDRILKIKTI